MSDISTNKVLVAISDQKDYEKIDQTYDNIEFVFNQDNDNEGVFFNKAQKLNSDITVFIGKGYGLSNTDSIKHIIEIIEVDKFSGFTALYSDIVLIDGITRYYPAYTVSVLQNKYILNAPFAVPSYFKVDFMEGLDELSLWSGILYCANHGVLYHLPKPVFKVQQIFDNINITQDIEKINEQYYS